MKRFLCAIGIHKLPKWGTAHMAITNNVDYEVQIQTRVCEHCGAKKWRYV